jgi:hypothetical protein
MKQETGETRNAIIEDDEKWINKIIDANKNRTDPYYIVLFSKRSRNTVDGKLALVKHIKAYATKPKPQVGMIVGTVNNNKGTIEWDVNMPQVPFDVNGLLAYGAQQCDVVVTETTSIPNAYITQ